jgi:hypothetical protein
MREHEGQTEELPEQDSGQTARLRRSYGLHTTKTLITAVIIAAVVMCAAGFYIIHLMGGENEALKQQIAATDAKEKAVSKELAEKKRVEEAHIRVEQEASKAKAALPTIGGTYAVVIGTLFKPDQRADAAAKSVGAFDKCKHNGQSLSFCFVEVGKKATEVVAVPKVPMTETEATNLAICFNDNLPILESGEKVGAFASNLSLNRYKGKDCLTQ